VITKKSHLNISPKASEFVGPPFTVPYELLLRYSFKVQL